jgi:hypothetical protein
MHALPAGTCLPDCKHQCVAASAAWTCQLTPAYCVVDAGCVPFGVQVSRPGVEQGPSTAAAVLGPGAYDPCYTYTERQTALQVLSFLHMLGRQDLQHPATAHQSGDAGDTSCGTGEDLVTAEDAWLRPRTKGYVDMQKVLSREAAEQLQAGARLLTSQIPLPDAHLGDVLRPRAPQVHIVEASEAAAGGCQLAPACHSQQKQYLLLSSWSLDRSQRCSACKVIKLYAQNTSCSSGSELHLKHTVCTASKVVYLQLQESQWLLHASGYNMSH